MRVMIDADGCPVVDCTISLCKEFHIPCTIVCDTAHEFQREDADTLTVDKGADSADYALVNRVLPGDIVITQDYGLASMCLARRALVMNQNGQQYTEANIDALLFSRHESRKLRAAGVRMKGPSKRTRDQDSAFETALRTLLSAHTTVQG